jgi:hypothetical protein
MGGAPVPAAAAQNMPPAGPVNYDSQNRILARLKSASEESRKAFMKDGKELESFGFTDKPYAELYRQFEEELDDELWFKAQVNRVSEFTDVVGPYLYPENPVVTVGSQPWATYWQAQRHKIEEQYIDYSLREGDMVAHARKWICQACIYGRGCLRIGFNAQKNVAQAVFIDINDVLYDPDARSIDEVNWVAIREYKPRWQLASQYPDKADEISGMESSTVCQTSEKQGQTSSQLIEVWSFYFNVGIGRYDEDATAAAGQVDDTPMKYVYAGDCTLEAGQWEIPFYEDGMMPVIPLDLRPRPGRLYPQSPIKPGLGHLKALNYLYTFYVTRARVTANTTLVAMDTNGNTVDIDELTKVMQSKDLGIIRVKTNGNEYKIQDLIQQFNVDSKVDEFMKWMEIIGREFEKATGLNEILYAGDTRTQPRSATEVDFKEKQSRNRIDDMKRNVENGMRMTVRALSFAGRWLQPSADIAELFGKQAGATWGELADDAQVQQEEEVRAQIGQQMMQQNQMQIQQYTQMTSRIPPGAMGPGMMPPPPEPLTIEKVEQQLGPLQFVSLKQWVHEADRTLEPGSMRRLDFDAQVDNLNVALNQLSPAVATLPGGALFVAAIAKEFTKLHRFSPDLQAAAQEFYNTVQNPPMPPPGMEPQGPGPEGPPRGKGKTGKQVKKEGG